MESIDPHTSWGLGIIGDDGWLLMIERRLLGSAGAARYTPVGVKWGQSTQSELVACGLQSP
jgi:hypothetical protein